MDANSLLVPFKPPMVLRGYDLYAIESLKTINDRSDLCALQLGDNNTFYIANSVAGRVVVFERNKDNTLTRTASIFIGMAFICTDLWHSVINDMGVENRPNDR